MKFPYLAGYVDGDGCFSVRKYTQFSNNSYCDVYDISLQIASVHREPLDFFFKEFGGIIIERKEKRKNRRNVFIWECKGNDFDSIAKHLLPFLVSKKKLCECCIDLRKSLKKSKTYRGKKISDEEIEFRKNLINTIKHQIHEIENVTQEAFINLKAFPAHKFDPIIYTEHDIQYFCGLIDAEGSFSISHYLPKRKGRNKSFTSRLTIANTKFPIFPWIMKRFGGNVIYVNKKITNHKPLIYWHISSNTLNKILWQIYPFLIVKKERCKILIDLFELTKESKSMSKFSSEETSAMIGKKEFLLSHLKVLNKRGK